MSRRQELAEKIQALKGEQDADLSAAHDEHHKRLDASTASFHAEKAKIRAKYAKKIDPIVAEHDALLTGEEEGAGGGR